MFKKKLLVQACALALALFTPFANYVIAEICIGKNYEYDAVEPENATPPTLKIERQDSSMPILNSGQTIDFKLIPTLATGENTVDFFICAPEGELVATAPDQIKYTAPSQIQSDQVIKIVAQVADSKGLVGGDNFYVQLKATTSTNACTNTRRKNSGKITICHKAKETLSIVKYL